MKRFLPLIILSALMLIAYLLDLHHYLTMEQIREHRTSLLAIVEAHPIQAPLLYMALYIIVTALSIPGAVFLTIAGGFLFPQPWATIMVVFSATLGACCIFLVAKTVLGDILKKKAGNLLNRMRKGFEENAINYLLFLRLVPIFPFWAVNLAPAFFGVSLPTFFWTTFLGIIPGTFVFAQAGTGLGAIFDAGKTLTIDTIFNQEVKIALIALGLFALLPIIIKKIRNRKK